MHPMTGPSTFAAREEVKGDCEQTQAPTNERQELQNSVRIPRRILDAPSLDHITTDEVGIRLCLAKIAQTL